MNGVDAALVGDRPGYSTLEIAYRYYGGDASDQLRVFGEVSQSVADQVSLAA